MVYPRGEMQGSQWPPKLALENLYYKAVVLKSRGLFLGTKGDLGCFYTHTLDTTANDPTLPRNHCEHPLHVKETKTMP